MNRNYRLLLEALITLLERITQISRNKVDASVRLAGLTAVISSAVYTEIVTKVANTKQRTFYEGKRIFLFFRKSAAKQVI